MTLMITQKQFGKLNLNSIVFTFLFIFLMEGIPVIDFAQNSKPSIDSSMYQNWPSVSGARISNDGRYASYIIENQPPGSQTTVLQSTITNWEKELTGINIVFFTDDSHKAIFKSADTLYLLTPGTDKASYILNVQSFKLQKSPKSEWLVYQLKGAKKQLVIRDLVTSLEKSWDSVTNYWFSANGKVLVTQREEKKDSGNVFSLNWIDPESGTTENIYQGNKVTDLSFDKVYSQFVFAVQDTKQKNSIWYYPIGKRKATLLVDDQSQVIDSDVKVNSLSFPGFSGNGRSVFISLIEHDYPKPKVGYVPVNIWNYQDGKLQSQQLKELKPKSYLAVVEIETKKITRLAKQGETVRVYDFNKFGLLEDNNISVWERSWNTLKRLSCIISNIDGSKVFELKKQFQAVVLSPGEKFVVYYDQLKQDYFSYELTTHITRNISKSTNEVWKKGQDARFSYSAYLPAAWTVNDTSVLLYDQYDIWQLDLLGKKPALNLTNGYGRKHNIIFRFNFSSSIKEVFNSNQDVVISALNNTNKNNGFFKMTVGRNTDPKLLTMGPYLYALRNLNFGYEPKKARDADVWIVQRQSATESPNYFSTTDFKTFRQLSNVYPEKKYNWLKAELHTWKSTDGQTFQGLLYKPENFDSSKKYPIIFHYYEKKSDRLNLYLQPEFAKGDLDIPTFVSQGYLIFEPDITPKPGYLGESSLTSVVSAANYLSSFPFVNVKKMGIQGMSFGGFENNYVVTHSKLFAAACTAAGGSDFISYYGSLFGEGSSQQVQFEEPYGGYRIGFTPWQRQDLFINNSPIFQADKVTTPLLLMHTTIDASVPFSQALEMFTALRRLGKPVWMLQYDEGNHGLGGTKSAADFTIRIQQFFDHYLKDKPAPVWMTKGIPARLKGVITGYDLDPSGNCGKDCKVCKMWNEKMKKDSAGTWKEIQENKE